MNDQIQPEELTELLDDDLEVWAQGGTRILPKSQLDKSGPKPDSVAPVAYASVPPQASIPPVAASSSAPVWAALIGMAAVFFFAAVGGGIFYAVHRAASATASTTSESVASPSVTVAPTSEPELPPIVTQKTTTSEPVVVVAPVVTATATPPQKVISISAAPPSVIRFGTIQTFAAGAGKPVFLDGKQIGTGGSHLKAACGRHSISVGSGKAKTYDVPCSGTVVTVGTPDGT